MSENANIQEGSGDAVITDSTPELTLTTIEDYLYGCVNIDVPKEAIIRILFDRGIEPGTLINQVEREQINLCKADLYVWMCMGVTRRGTVSDTDNGWTHSDGGFTISTEDKKLFMKMANSIYEENGEKPVGKVKFKVSSHGITPSNRSIFGNPLLHIIK